MISSLDILRETNIASAKTLTRWHQRGLIPPPTINLHPSGRGKVAYWHDWVLERCLRIRQLTDQGYDLDKIAELLGDDWNAIERQYNHRRYVFHNASATIDFRASSENFIELVSHRLTELFASKTQQSQMSKRWQEYVRQNNVATLIDLIDRGFNPVLVIEGGSLRVVPDFLVSAMFSFDKFHTALVVMPIRQDARTAFAAVFPKWPESPSIAAAERVVDATQKKPRERQYKRLGDWHFELLD